MKKYNVKNYIRWKEDIKVAIQNIPNKPFVDLTNEQLKIKFLPLVENIGRKFATSQEASGVMSIMDIIQEGSLQLCKAVDKIDKEVLYDEQTGVESCYYCGCEELEPSEFTDESTECRYCPTCESDILLKMKEVPDPNQIQLELDEDEKEWNKSFGITDTDYKDISDSYDDSVEHRTIVNEYLKTK